MCNGINFFLKYTYAIQRLMHQEIADNVSVSVVTAKLNLNKPKTLKNRNFST